MLELFLVIDTLTVYNNITTMEIKLNAGDTFIIPEGCKATIEGDLIVIKEKNMNLKSLKTEISCTH